MKRNRPIRMYSLAVLLLFVFVGCTHQQPSPSNTNTTNQSNSNLSQEVNVNTTANINTNPDQEVDADDWLTYTNEEYGFSFKYPEDWSIEEDKGWINLYNEEASIKKEYDPLVSPDLYVRVTKRENNSSVSVKDEYKEKAEYAVVEEGSGYIAIRFDEFNEYANSTNTYYYLENFQNKMIISTIYFKNSLQVKDILNIIESLEFNS